MRKVSIVICAYNEEKTIANVVRDIRKFNPGSEVIVVDDGSSDGTENILRKLGKELSFVYERLPENKGKSYAMVRGVEISRHNVILFFDADLTNISQQHFHQLLEPIFDGEADMVLGQPSETLIDYRINPFRSLTGQRAMLKKDLLPILGEIRNIRFGVETFINLHYQANSKKIKYVLLEGLTHPVKYSKTTPVKATKEFISEGQEIAATLLDNHDLILKTIENSIKKTNKQVNSKISGIQKDIHQRIIMFRDRVK